MLINYYNMGISLPAFKFFSIITMVPKMWVYLFPPKNGFMMVISTIFIKLVNGWGIERCMYTEWCYNG
jgi:hypothetical protein